MSRYRIISNGSSYRIQERTLWLFWVTLGEQECGYGTDCHRVPTDYRSIEEALLNLERFKAIDQQEANRKHWRVIYKDSKNA